MIETNTTVEVKSVKNPVMTLITKAEMGKLLKAGIESEKTGETGKPIIKLFCGPLTWLVTDIDRDGILNGYAYQVGMQCVEFGGLCHIDELPTMSCRFAYLERDRHFTAKAGVNYFDLDSLVGI